MINAPDAKAAPSFFLREDTWRELSGVLQLSPRESQIVRCMLAGLDKNGTAAELGISSHTVHAHLERLYRKLGVSSRADVVVRAFSAYVDLYDHPADPADAPECRSQDGAV